MVTMVAGARYGKVVGDSSKNQDLVDGSFMKLLCLALAKSKQGATLLLTCVLF